MEREGDAIDTVLFLGAGASQFAGYHTFQRFGALMTDRVVRLQEGLPPQSDDTPRLIESLNQALRDMHRPTTHDNYLWLLTDYHTFCGKFDTHSGLQERFPRIRDEIHAFDSTIVTVINDLTQTTYCHYSRQRDLGPAGQEVRSLYEELASLNDAREPFLPLFTTNYDLLLEDLFGEKRGTPPAVPLVNGLPFLTRKGGRWSTRRYTKAGIHLYRLHGSVGWFRGPDERSRTSITFERPSRLDGDLLDRLCVMFPGRELQLGSAPHGYAFSRLHAYLSLCDRVVFIGFSFRDDDVMQVLLAANATRVQPLQLRIIDPSMGREEVRDSLQGASLRSPFRSAVPELSEIRCLRMEFGTLGFKQTLMEFLDE